MRRAISTSAAHLPLRPYGLAGDRALQNCRAQIGNVGEDLLPVPPDLLASDKTTRRVNGSFVPVVRCETVDECIEVARIRGASERVDHAGWTVRVRGAFHRRASRIKIFDTL